MRFLVFDCEAVGLHGETFAVGMALVEWTNGKGRITPIGPIACPPELARGTRAGREWVEANVPTSRLELDCTSARAVRDNFWTFWQSFQRGGGGYLAADVPWPVEARFLMECVADDPEAREWQGPYPLVDISSVRLAAGLDPLAEVERLPDELPPHDPMCDARQSARLLIEALVRLDVESLGIYEPAVEKPRPVLEPHRDAKGEPVTLLGMPIVVNPELEQGKPPVFGRPRWLGEP